MSGFSFKYFFLILWCIHFSVALPYRFFVYIVWLLTLCFCRIPEYASEWLSESISAIYAFSWADRSTWKDQFAMSAEAKQMHYLWYSNSLTGNFLTETYTYIQYQ